MPAYGGRLHPLRCVRSGNEMARNNDTFSWTGFACATGLHQGRLPIHNYQLPGNTENGYYQPPGTGVSTYKGRGAYCYAERSG